MNHLCVCVCVLRALRALLQVAEFGRPEVLERQPGSLYRSLLEETARASASTSDAPPAPTDSGATIRKRLRS